MAKPIIKHITPFDATKPYEISISWLGNRAHANRIVIYDNETNNVVFDDMVSSFILKHTIPANILTNGKKYVIQSQVYDIYNTHLLLLSIIILQIGKILTNTNFVCMMHPKSFYVKVQN